MEIIRLKNKADHRCSERSGHHMSFMWNGLAVSFQLMLLSRSALAGTCMAFSIQEAARWTVNKSGVTDRPAGACVA